MQLGGLGEGDVVTEMETQRWGPEVNSRDWTGKKMGGGYAQRGASLWCFGTLGDTLSLGRHIPGLAFLTFSLTPAECRTGSVALFTDDESTAQGGTGT